MKTNVLLIDDDVSVRHTIASLLDDDGYNVCIAGNANDAKTSIKNSRYDVILLDLHLPDGNGINLIPTIRMHTDAPIIIISGKADMADRVYGLEMGADDYITKPLQLREMSARIKAQIRRYKNFEDRMAHMSSAPKLQGGLRIRFGDYILDRQQMQVFKTDGQNLGLTVREFRLLEVLVLAPKQVHTREQILNKVRADNLDISDRAVDVQFLRIRRKLGISNTVGQLIKAVRGLGYMLDCAPMAAE